MAKNKVVMCMHQIKIFYMFVSNLRVIYQFGNKIAFAVQLRAMAAKKTDFRVKNGIFLVHLWY